MTNTLLEIKNLSTFYKSIEGPVKAVDEVNFVLERGENLGLVGESGCGKTTIIKSIMRLLPRGAYSTGEIIFDGNNLLTLSLSDMRKVRWKDISIVSQSAMNALDPVYRVGNQITEAILNHSSISKKEAWERAEELFALVGIEKTRLLDYPHQFSGGMRQRAIIAMALALNPAVIVADEPTTALDVVVQAQILRRIRDLQKQLNSSMIMVTHDISVVAETCQKVVVMYAGKVVESGSVEVVFGNPYHPYTMGLKNAFPDIKGEKFDLISIPGYPPDLIDPPKGCRFADRCPFATYICQTSQPDNKEITEGHVVACHHTDQVESMRKEAQKYETWLNAYKGVEQYG
ncbi:ABC transporter ATP-binding protein [Bacillus sp. 522_BSPC]|uniref:ABC transporter ATP-binding protein n=1 Tax=Bacillus sp. 522_BSPC TaxID=1579338 RepID=UPI000660CBAD|nr:ABC transporter ATP-binding protein [Bacillus sp. 522_BSPC]